MTRDVKLKAANGKELPAVKVITITLEHLKNLILKQIEEQIPHPNRRIQWILTVPAIWSEGAKQMMREAATEVHTIYMYNTYNGTKFSLSLNIWSHTQYVPFIMPFESESCEKQDVI